MNDPRKPVKPIIINSFLLVWLLFSSFTGPRSEQYEPSREYQVKAVFLYNFAQFVKWPDQTFAGSNSPMIIGVLGKDPFGKFLDETITGEMVDGHPLQVRRFKSPEEIKDCHILYISSSDEQEIRKYLKDLKGKTILTVGESENFGASGGIIRFATEDDHIRLFINLQSARSVRLDISSKLLRLSTIEKTDAANEG